MNGEETLVFSKTRERKLVLILLTLFAVNLISPNSAINFDQEPNLTEGDALSIAMNDPEVEAWVTETDAFHQIYYDGDLFWIIEFYPNTPDMREWLVVVINDETSEIVEISFIVEDYYYENSVIIDQAIQFAQNIEMLENMLAIHNDLLWSGWQDYAPTCVYEDSPDGNVKDCEPTTSMNRVFVSAYDYSSNIFLEVQLQSNQTSEDVFSFELVGITSNTEFGTSNNSFDEVSEAIMNNEFVQEFIERNDEYYTSIAQTYVSKPESVVSYFFPSLILNQGYYFGIYFNPGIDYYSDVGVPEVADGEDVTEPVSDEPIGSVVYNYYDWLNVVFEDSSNSVIDVYGPSTAENTQEAILDLVLAIPEFHDWISTIDNFHADIFFDGYDLWYVSIWAEDNFYDYGWATVEDSTSSVLSFDVTIHTPATLGQEEVLSILMDESKVREWTESAYGYDFWIFYDGFGTWWVYIYDYMYISNYIYAEVEDTSGSILNLEVHSSPLPEHEPSEVFDLALDNGLDEFLNTYKDALLFVFYDGYGNWYVYSYSPILIEAYFSVVISDESFSIKEKWENHPDNLPTKSVPEVENLLRSYDEFIAFQQDGEVTVHMYYVDGYWYVTVAKINSKNYYEYLHLQVDDASGEVSELQWELLYAEAGGYSDAANEAGDQAAGALIGANREIPANFNPELKTFDHSREETTSVQNSPLSPLPGLQIVATVLALMIVTVIAQRRNY